MSQSSKKRNGYIVEIFVIAGYVIFFCLALTLYLAFLVFIVVDSQKRPPAVNIFATSLPPTTPNPHISPADQPGSYQIFMDDFTDDRNHWEIENDLFKEEVTNGKLYFESLVEGYYAFTGCEHCPYLKDPFYLQADLTTTQATAENFGIIFSLNYNTCSFYLFQINTESRMYSFYHYTKSENGWSRRAGGESDQIKSFPAINTLGLYVKEDTIEFYINGNVVDSYTESGNLFYKGDFSFYVNDANFKLVVDNLKIINIGK